MDKTNNICVFDFCTTMLTTLTKFSAKQFSEVLNNQFDSTCTSISKATMYSFELKFTPLNLKILSKKKVKVLFKQK